MSREVRRVPIDWKHPVEPNPHWVAQRTTPYGRTKPASRLHGPTERFIPLYDSDYAERLAEWEQEGRELAARTGHGWTFGVQWHLTGVKDCTCALNHSSPIHYEAKNGLTHPAYAWSEDGMWEHPFVVRDEDHLQEVLLAEHEREKPDPADYMPTFDVPESELGWCLYETVSEGTPVTPVFATAEELIEHLTTVGQDWDQVPMRRSAAEALVSQGYTIGSFVVTSDRRLLKSDMDADLIGN